ncbi:MAG TPA: hypothetical protein PKN33_02825 [Phycisphaerae bacterium]|nr:hypothetical protein [Phycisphaerae bacterium]
MKGLVTFAVIAGILVLGGYYGLGSMLSSGPDHMVAFACGKSDGQTVEIQIAIPIAMVRIDPPKVEFVGNSSVELWDEWIPEHFNLRTGSSEPVVLERGHFASLIPDHKVGTPDSYLTGRLEIGKPYVFDYTPKVSEGKTYRFEFTPTEDGPPFAREIFEPVK